MQFSVDHYPLFEDQKVKYTSSYLNIPFLKLSIGLKNGTNDRVYVRYLGERFYVIAMNSRYEYLGLEVFDKEGEECGNVFLQGGEQIEECLSRKADKVFDMSIPWIIKSLQPYAEEY